MLYCHDRAHVTAFCVHEKDMLSTAVARLEDLPEHFLIGRRPVLPPGSEIQQIVYEWSRRCFFFIIRNESFPTVAPFAEIEIVQNPLDLVQIYAVREPDGRYRIEEADELFRERKSDV